IQGDRAVFNVEGLHKLWSFRSRLDIPLAHIRAVEIDPEAARGWWHGLRVMGSNIPGVLTAGTFYQDGGIVFYDVHDPDRTILLELEHETYKRLIVEVEDPEATRQMIERALKSATKR
ncbi:MAG TPA: hypothetical protein VF856_00045, partial [Gemmatimonadaceae bacterium]